MRFHHTPTSTRDRHCGVLTFIVGNLLLGTIGIFVHEAGADPVTATWFRCASGVGGLTLWLLARGDMAALRLTRSSASRVLGAAVLMVGAWTLFFAAIERTSAGLASVLFHVQPLWVVVLGVCLLREPVAPRRLFAVGLAMAGLVLATGVVHQASSSAGQVDPDHWVGVVLCITGAACTAGVTLLVKRSGDGVPAGVFAWWQCAVGALVLLPWPACHGWPAWGPSWAWLVGLGLVPTALAYSLMYVAIPRLGTDRIVVLQFIYPGVAVLIDWLFYDLHLGWMQFAGMALMALAIGYAERTRPGA